MIQEDSLKDQHELWMQNPYTQLLFKALEKHRGKHVEMLVVNSANEVITDASIRHTAISLRTVTATIEILKSHEQVGKLLNK